MNIHRMSYTPCFSGGVAEDSILPGCDIASLGNWFLKFWGNIVLKPEKKNYPVTQHYTPEEWNSQHTPLLRVRDTALFCGSVGSPCCILLSKEWRKAPLHQSWRQWDQLARWDDAAAAHQITFLSFPFRLLCVHRAPSMKNANSSSYWRPWPSAGAVWRSLRRKRRVQRQKIKACGTKMWLKKKRSCVKSESLEERGYARC